MQRQGNRRAALTVALNLELLLVLAEGAMPLRHDVAILRIVDPVCRNEDTEAIPVVREQRNCGQRQFRTKGPQPARTLKTHRMGARADRLVDDLDQPGPGDRSGVAFLPQRIPITVNAEVPLLTERILKSFK